MEKDYRIIPSRKNRSTEYLHIEKEKREQDGDIVLASTLTNRGDAIKLAFVQPVIFEFETEIPKKDIRFFVNGFTSFSGSGSFHLEEKEIESLIPHLRQLHRNFHVPRQKRKGFFTSSLFGVLKLSSDTEVTLGFLDCRKFFTQVKTEAYENRIRLTAQIQFDDLTISAGERLRLPDIFISRNTPFRALGRYATILSKNMGIETRAVPNGWCSWYHYFTDITETKFLNNLQTADQFEPSFDIFQLDDGYAPVLGHFEQTNRDFPSGLEKLAKRVAAAGFIPGIWTAPFMVQKKTPIVQRHPDWLLRDINGKPVVGMWNPNWGIFRYAYVLDISRADVREYLMNLFQTLHQYGFRFFKLDFLFAACLPGIYDNSGQSSLHILREGLSIIRKAVGDALILGCGCPLEAGIGLIDSMRVGNDVTPYWSNLIDKVVGGGFEQLSTKNCLRNTLTRGFMQGCLFQNDPDCLITRREKNKLTPTEIITLGQVNTLSGGPLMISDDLNRLHPESIDLLKRLFKLQTAIRSSDRVFLTPDFMDQRMPQLQLAQGEKDAYLGVYNFSDHPKRQFIDLSSFIAWKAYTVVDDNTGKPIPRTNDILKTEIIPPHGALLFYLRKK